MIKLVPKMRRHTTTELVDDAWVLYREEMVKRGSKIVSSQPPADFQVLLRVIDWMLQQRVLEHMKVAVEGESRGRTKYNKNRIRKKIRNNLRAVEGSKSRSDLDSDQVGTGSEDEE